MAKCIKSMFPNMVSSEPNSKKFQVNLYQEDGAICFCTECCNCNCTDFIDKAICIHLVASCIVSRFKYPGCYVIKANTKKTAGRYKKAKNALLKE